MKEMIVLKRPWERPPDRAIVELWREENRTAYRLSIYFADNTQAHIRIGEPSRSVTPRVATEHLTNEIKYKATATIRDGTARGERRWEAFLQADWSGIQQHLRRRTA